MKTQYEKDLDEAYERLEKDFWSIGRDSQGNPCFPALDEDVLYQIKIVTGRCGAACGAAGKREKRDLVFSFLQKKKSLGADFTVRVVLRFCNKVLGRGVDNREVMKVFGTPGRLPGDKSLISPDTLESIEAELVESVEKLKQSMKEIRIKKAAWWRSSDQRKKVLDDWRKQRIHTIS